MSVGNVANPLAKAQASFNIGEFTLEKSLMSALNVANPLAANLTSFSTTDFTLEKDLRCIGNVQFPFSIITLEERTCEGAIYVNYNPYIRKSTVERFLNSGYRNL